MLTDFGLARAADDVSMTRQGIIAGTPEYMSPEQARGEALDGRSDLFSLGHILPLWFSSRWFSTLWALTVLPVWFFCFVTIMHTAYDIRSRLFSRSSQTDQ
jgi:serine/threonine protein kinase